VTHHANQTSYRKLHVAWNKGTPRSEETKRKISESLKGENNPHFGKPLSEEHRRKISKALKGTPSWIKGKHHTPETRHKISDSLKGKKLSEDTILKIIERLKGIHTSARTEFKKGHEPWDKGKQRTREYKQKVSKAMKGQRKSEGHKEKLRVARLKQIFPTKDTSIEIAVQNELKRRNIPFKTSASAATCLSKVDTATLRMPAFSANGLYLAMTADIST